MTTPSDVTGPDKPETELNSQRSPEALTELSEEISKRKAQVSA
jgi:hypothetical protein